MQEAQEIYWFEHDLAEKLIDGTEAEFGELIKQLKGGAEGFPEGPAQLVIDLNAADRARAVRAVASLEGSLRNVPKDRLLKVLESIVINPEQMDLPMIFDKYLAEHKHSWAEVRKLTMSPEQEQFLRKVRPANEPDLSSHQRFVDYVMGLRTVRYRKDIVGLLARHGFKEFAPRIKKLDQEDRERVRGELRKWDEPKLAKAIAAIVSIRDKGDYELVRDNHKLNLLAVESLSFARPLIYTEMDMEGRSSGRGTRPASPMARALPGGMAMPGGMRSSRLGPGGMEVGEELSELAKVTTFSMRVKIEFERIPVFQREFINSSWHYTLDIKQISPAGSGFEGEGGMPRVGSRGLRGSGGRTSRPLPGGAAPSPMARPGGLGTRDLMAPGMPAAGIRRPTARSGGLGTRDLMSPGMPPAGMRRSTAMPGALGTRDLMAPGGMRRPGVAGRRGREGPEVRTVESSRYVWLDCECKAFQYTKLMKKVRARQANVGAREGRPGKIETARKNP